MTRYKAVFANGISLATMAMTALAMAAGMPRLPPLASGTLDYADGPAVWMGAGGVKHRNRTPGQRAHRRWKQRRSSGRA